MDDQVGGFLIESNTFTNYSFGFDINGGGRHTLRNNTFGPCPHLQCTLVVSQHAVGGKRHVNPRPYPYQSAQRY